MWQNDKRRILSPAEKTSKFNLVTAIRSGIRGYRDGPDIVIKCFKNLGTVFFGEDFVGMSASNGRTCTCMKSNISRMRLEVSVNFLGNANEGRYELS